MCTTRRAVQVHFSASGMDYECLEVGVLTANGQRKTDVLRSGEVGYMQGGIKAVDHARVGDTITIAGSDALPLPGYQEPVPMVYCGLFPVETTQYQLLRESLERLKLNDAALRWEPESSSAMGFGFRVGFLGLLHMEIVQVRAAGRGGQRFFVKHSPDDETSSSTHASTSFMLLTAVVRDAIII
eukprot:76339-Pleurochrysis_carterae.AAC.1